MNTKLFFNRLYFIVFMALGVMNAAELWEQETKLPDEVKILLYDGNDLVAIRTLNKSIYSTMSTILQMLTGPGSLSNQIALRVDKITPRSLKLLVDLIEKMHINVGCSLSPEVQINNILNDFFNESKLISNKSQILYELFIAVDFLGVNLVNHELEYDETICNSISDELVKDLINLKSKEQFEVCQNIKAHEPFCFKVLKKLDSIQRKPLSKKEQSDPLIFLGKFNKFLSDEKIMLDENRYASVADRKTIVICDKSNSSNCITQLTGHTGTITCIEKLDDVRFASGSDYPDKTIRIWDLETNKCMKILHGHIQSIKCLKKLDKNRLASGSEISFIADDALRIWDINTGECMNILEGNRTNVISLLRIDDNTLASGSSGGEIILWNCVTDKYFQILPHEGPVQTLEKVDDCIVSSGSRSICNWHLIPAIGYLRS